MIFQAPGCAWIRLRRGAPRGKRLYRDDPDPGIASGTADHNLNHARDLPFPHSFDPFYPQALLIVCDNSGFLTRAIATVTHNPPVDPHNVLSISVIGAISGDADHDPVDRIAGGSLRFVVESV
ncbi:hypothetical protein EF878_05170 [Dickeya undicola]|uniref:Uncharacterized protein n=1 Tax=Dickeya undicola TaxID=1577887 RepID=A0A3N0G6Q6_9GAMM|nr:hypothetical protein EF878_05170 [Dickeya undicola]